MHRLPIKIYFNYKYIVLESHVANFVSPLAPRNGRLVMCDVSFSETLNNSDNSAFPWCTKNVNTVRDYQNCFSNNTTHHLHLKSPYSII